MSSASVVRLQPEAFSEALVEQFRRMPWMLVSVLFHGMVVLLVMMFGTPNSLPPIRSAAALLLEETQQDVLDEEPTEPEDHPIPVESVSENDVVTDTSPDVDSAVSESEIDQNSDTGSGESSPISAADNTIGLGGGALGAKGNGPGFGRGRGRRRGAFNDAARRGIDWLTRHQSSDGSFDSDGFRCEANDASGNHVCWGRGGALHDVGLTGLVVMAYLGAGERRDETPRGRALSRALDWLLSQQDAEGCFGSRSDGRFTYRHALATLAVNEALNAQPSLRLREAAARANDFCLTTRNPGSAWRYGERPGNNDVSITVWMVMALKSAVNAGFEIPADVFREVVVYLDQMTDDEVGRTGYTVRGETSVREAGLEARFPGVLSESMTAAAVSARIFCGQDPASTPVIRLGGSLLERCLPRWDPAGGSIDMYYWYYGTLATYQMGGAAWDRWAAALHESVVKTQISDGPMSGSWDPIDAWSGEGGRIYSTVMQVLTLETYYRYSRVFRVR